MKDDFLLPYPTVTEALVSSIEFVDFVGGMSSSFQSEIEGEIQSVLVNQDGVNSYSIADNQDLWHPHRNNLILNYDFVISNPSIFFIGDVAISDVFSTLGLALRWKNKDARVRGTFPLCGDDILSSSNKCHFKGQFKFPAKMLNGTLNLELIIYLKASGSLFGVHNQFCHVIGSNLGVLCTNCISITTGSNVFPYIKNPSDSLDLWGFVIENVRYEEEEVDEDSVYLWVNPKHPDYIKYDLEKKFESTFFKEMLASFYYNLILTVYLSDKEAFFDKTYLKKNSIANYVRILVLNEFVGVKDFLSNNNYVAVYEVIRKKVLSKGLNK